MGTRRALLVATADYQDARLPQLRAPIHDLQAVAKVLGDPAIGGYEVAELRNQPVHLIQRAVQRFLVGTDPDDELLLYFSCHGLKDDEEQLYFAGTDTEPEPALLESHAVPAGFVSKYLQAADARRKVLLLDCCFSGAFRAGAKSADPGINLGATFTEAGTVVISASDELQQAFELVDPTNARPLSVFTDAVVRGLHTGAADLDGDGHVSADDLYRYATRSLRESGSKQRPKRWVLDGVGDLVIARCRDTPDPQLPVPEPPTPAPRRPPFDDDAIVRALAAAVPALDIVVTAGSDPDLQRLARGIQRITGETMLGYLDRGHYPLLLNNFLPIGRRHRGFVIFTDSAVHLPGGDRLPYMELADHEISARTGWQNGHARQGGGHANVHLDLKHPYRTITLGGGSLDELQALADLLTQLGQLAAAT